MISIAFMSYRGLTINLTSANTLSRMNTLPMITVKYHQSRGSCMRRNHVCVIKQVTVVHVPLKMKTKRFKI
ncbi:hypothetical protein TL16_g10870 [Triparma laevis f. inornata]|uniref:Uncharacterized protein n=1 Tax=Triparma laevis f. inornata TaxID=1714386 RepID=A0A9W7BAV6_9STRA|nr:hypothetical protein TL16_g10870 [Triparma laevis f. inornata]